MSDLSTFHNGKHQAVPVETVEHYCSTCKKPTEGEIEKGVFTCLDCLRASGVNK